MNRYRRTARLRAPLVALLLACATLPGIAAAESATYALDPVHTRVQFAISHAGFSQAIGTVSGSAGTLVFDPDDWSTARIEVSVPLTRLDLGDAKWNASALAGNLLDGKDHPVATFASSRIETVDATHAIVHGTLTLRGVAQPVALQVTFNQLKRHPLPPFRRTAGFSATAHISRKAFGITAWPSVIGDAVELRIEAEATRSNAAMAPSNPAAASGDDVPASAVETEQIDNQPGDGIPIDVAPADDPPSDKVPANDTPSPPAPTGPAR